MIANPYAKYRQTQVQTASPEQLVLMLYDGAIRFALQGKDHIETSDFAGANHCLVRVQDIVSELQSSLNHDVGEIAAQLELLYDYLHRRAMEANVAKDSVIIDEIVDLFRVLRNTWAEAVILARQSIAAAADGSS